MNSTDILLVLIISGAALVGFFWGVLRMLVLLAAWCVAFIAAAYLAEPVGRYLAGQWTGLGSAFNHTAAFGLAYAVGLVAAIVVVHLAMHGAPDLTRSALLDDVVGAVLGAAAAVLGIAGLVIVLNTFYGASSPGGSPGPDWTQSIYRGISESLIGGDIERSLVPTLGALLGPILPDAVHSAMR